VYGRNSQIPFVFLVWPSCFKMIHRKHGDLLWSPCYSELPKSTKQNETAN
jgi:hypothetical protein